MSSTTEGQSHRERVKAERRTAIENAAHRLFAEQGYEETTVAQIAEAAGVSARTVAMYFPSKVDLVASHVRESVDRLVGVVDASPTDTSMLDIFAKWLEGESDCFTPELAALRAAMFNRNPGLRGVTLDLASGVIEQVKTRLAHELGKPAGSIDVLVAVAACSGIMERYHELVLVDDEAAVRASIVTFLSGALAGIAARPR